MKSSTSQFTSAKFINSSVLSSNGRKNKNNFDLDCTITSSMKAENLQSKQFEGSVTDDVEVNYALNHWASENSVTSP